MYTYKNISNSTLSFTDDEGEYRVFTPGKEITLKRVYNRLGAYGIKLLKQEKKKVTKITKEDN